MFDPLHVTVITLVLALVLDRCIGEPASWHPLILFGRWADFCRHLMLTSLTPQLIKHQTTAKMSNSKIDRITGLVAWSITVLPILILVSGFILLLSNIIGHIVSVIVLYVCIGWQSLREHAFAVLTPLRQGDLPQARQAVGYIVSRDTDSLSEEEVTKAGIESVLENGSDAIFAPIFWFFILGVPGVLLYRLANTLDAMWGYKNATFLYFGWWAARVDDVLNFVPARFVVVTYAIGGNFTHAIKAAKETGFNWKSPNAGPVMAAGAGALMIQLGGKATYFGKIEERPILGKKEQAINENNSNAPLTVTDLQRAITLVDRGVWLWIAVSVAALVVSLFG
ncbi:cobalamin biosynthesis protein CobD [Marinomonas agarivorans]|nr:cobalamin biosynthesis protein CobD [Marinomonas agarivorans]